MNQFEKAVTHPGVDRRGLRRRITAAVVLPSCLGFLCAMGNAVPEPVGPATGPRFQDGPSRGKDTPKREAESPKVTESEARAAVAELRAALEKDDFPLPVLRERHRSEAIRKAGKLDHSQVARELIALLKKSKGKERLTLIDALGHQRRSTKSVAPRLARMFEPRGKDLDQLVHVVEALGNLRYKRLAEDFTDLFAHEEDRVAFAAVRAVGAIGDRSVLPKVRTLFELNTMDPETGVAVRVDTGSPGGQDRARARAAGKRREALRRKNSKKAVEAIRTSLRQLCGTEIKTPNELRDWMEENPKLWK